LLQCAAQLGHLQPVGGLEPGDFGGEGSTTLSAAPLVSLSTPPASPEPGWVAQLFDTPPQNFVPIQEGV
jgi:hypothetical protein